MSYKIPLVRLWSKAFAKQGGTKLLNSSGTLFFVAKRRDLRELRFSNVGVNDCAPRVMFSTTPLVQMARRYLDSPPASSKAVKKKKRVEDPKKSYSNLEIQDKVPNDEVALPTDELKEESLSLEMAKEEEERKERTNRVNNLIQKSISYQSSQLAEKLQKRLDLLNQLQNATATISSKENEMRGVLRSLPDVCVTAEQARVNIPLLEKKLRAATPSDGTSFTIGIARELKEMKNILVVEELALGIKESQNKLHVLETELVALEVEIKSLTDGPSSYEDPSSVHEFLVRTLKDIDLRPNRLTGFPRRFSNNFLRGTAEREAALFHALEYAMFVHRYSKADRLAILVMLASSGSGKTHMIDQIPRSAKVLLTNMKKELTQRRHDLEKRPTSSLTDTEKRHTDYDLLKVDQMIRDLESKMIFTPLSFNSFVTIEDSEKDLPIECLIVARLLFCYFCDSVDISVFLQKFGDLIKNVSVRTALEVIRHDQCIPHGDEPDVLPKDKETSRLYLLVDEVSKVAPEGTPDYLERRRSVYVALKKAMGMDR